MPEVPYVMSDNTDALEHYVVAIERTRRGQLAQWETEHMVRAMRLLAAEVRTLQARVAELESHIAATDPWKEAKP